MEIFGNEISRKVEKKAIKGQKKFIRKFGDDRNTEYHLGLVDNPVITGPLGVKNIVITDDKKTTLARLSLVWAVKSVLEQGLNILAVTAPERM